MKLSDLASAGREPGLPLTVDLGETCVLEVERWLRVLPAQRYVCRANFDGRLVLAKLMVGGKAEKNFIRERDGAALLVNQQMPTPALLSSGCVAGQGGWLLFDFLEGSQSLWDSWRAVEAEAPLSVGQHSVLSNALTLIAEMHLRGLWQDDLHLENFIVSQGILHVVDGGGVKAQEPGKPLSRNLVLKNLGVFFAQLPAALEPFLEDMLVPYLMANNTHALPLETLLRETRIRRSWRLDDYLKKTVRDCSLFQVSIGPFRALAARREEADLLSELEPDPDQLIESGQLYKNGGSATVARVELCERAVLIKRYNIKSPVHWLKRFWRPSRAWHSWVEGNRLNFLGVPTPRPLAMKEQRWLWMRGRAWLVTELLTGDDIIARFQPHLDGAPPECELLALDRLFAALIRERISHGDLKGHNIFWEKGRWMLIDLDSVRQHRGDASFSRAYARDRARFLRNWPSDSALHRLLDQRLPAVPGTHIEN
ncbi:lipopolysaccharide kinase InaA family protein [Stutzerimonas chloritidismutans]|uniref:lipopolysaccharide kinase InaA family protein n=1 Tax=Stutzerimonas chloritidismutans TaxID=203192 RepID=UPI003F138308